MYVLIQQDCLVYYIIYKGDKEMRELFKRLRTMKISVIFYEQTDNFMVQLFRYVFVGGIAFVADWGMMVFLHEIIHKNVYIAIAIAFVFGLIVNFILSKIFVFQEASEKTGTIGEFIVYGVIGGAGLLFTEIIMWLLLKIGIVYMIAKIVAAAIVLIWNFIARKILLY